jgi:hypothetical protein
LIHEVPMRQTFEIEEYATKRAPAT